MTTTDTNLKAATPKLLDALLDVKRLAAKSDDNGFDPWTLLELIHDRVLDALGAGHEE